MSKLQRYDWKDICSTNAMEHVKSGSNYYLAEEADKQIALLVEALTPFADDIDIIDWDDVLKARTALAKLKEGKE